MLELLIFALIMIVALIIKVSSMDDRIQELEKKIKKQ